MTKGRVLPIGLMLMALALPLLGHSLTLTDDRQEYQGAIGMQWLADPDHSLTPSTALKALREGAGATMMNGYPSLGFQDGLQWFLITLDNNTRFPYWFLRISRPHLDFLDIYLFDRNGDAIDHQRMGDRIPFTQREFKHYHLISLQSFPPQDRSYLLIRAQGDNIIEMPVSIKTPVAFSQQDNQISLLHGIYYGAIIAMCMFNLLIFISIREPSYMLYVLYLGTFGLNLFTREGLSYQWLWPDSPMWNHYSLPALNLLTLAFSMLFVSHFLELRTRLPKISRAISAVTVMSLLAIPFTLISFHYSIQVTTAAVLPWPFIMVVLSLWLIFQGYSPARYFLLAFLSVALATTLYILKAFQIIEASWLIENIMQLGTFLEAVLLSFALAHRMTVLKSENARIQREATEALEQRVEERTRELNSALSARSEFLAVMSHEIRTPLNGIIGTVDMLKSSPLDSEQQHNLNIIEQSGNSLLNLINDILDYSRIEAGKMPIEQTRFDLHGLINDSLGLFQHKARVQSNVLGCELDANLGHFCIGDPVRLRQILVNLISNAVKFTDNGTVTLTAHRDSGNADYVLFEIIDTGIGISPEQITHLFDHFQQGDSSTSRRYGGTGLGLAICKQLVEIMGGEIGVESRRNEGSRFWFRLPLPKTEASAKLPVVQDISDATRSGGRLLIVDDNHINLMVAEGLCKKLGYTTEVAESGMEAIAVLLSANEPFDLILMDCEMPEMDGFETSRSIIKLQKEGRLPRVPIIALTAHAVPDKIQACHDAGMVGHLAKPINSERLLMTLKQVLRDPDIRLPGRSA
ncbi:hybrid sensor histidine kinase/response regulator [Alcanivorax sediminis]|uniref:histidine kinase n=1 Tax=Alcanivorax sediminis TaxID=2663008 RepID=A0A6N7LWI3_9GAMM|nr:hybrid sensor histidine kinase/response regulator [Alcanivorax sediminis]MQX54807.1 response regulator [Alcanivorax sediminis]